MPALALELCQDPALVYGFAPEFAPSPVSAPPERFPVSAPVPELFPVLESITVSPEVAAFTAKPPEVVEYAAERPEVAAFEGQGKHKTSHSFI